MNSCGKERIETIYSWRSTTRNSIWAWGHPIEIVLYINTYFLIYILKKCGFICVVIGLYVSLDVCNTYFSGPVFGGVSLSCWMKLTYIRLIFQSIWMVLDAPVLIRNKSLEMHWQKILSSRDACKRTYQVIYCILELLVGPVLPLSAPNLLPSRTYNNKQLGKRSQGT